MRRMILLMIGVSIFVDDGLCQGKGHFQVNSSSNVHFIIVDPLGRQAGGDPRGIVQDTLYDVTFLREIPGASYVYSGTASLDPDVEEKQTMEFMYTSNSEEANGVYLIRVFGVELGEFWIDIDISRNNNGSILYDRFLVKGVIDKDSVVVITLNYSHDLNRQNSYSKRVNASTHLQDLAAMRKLGWITADATSDKYRGFITTYETHFEQDDFVVARGTLNTILQELATDSGSTITVDAYRLLRADVEQLLGFDRPRFRK